MGPAPTESISSAPDPVTPRVPGRARVEDVTVVLLTRVDGPALDPVLDALAAQTRLPQRLLVSGLDPEGEQLAAVREHALVADLRVPVLARGPLLPRRHDVPGDRLPGLMLEDARGVLPVHEEHWLWLLHDDSLPEPDALEALEGAVRRNSRVGVVGPKLVRLDDPRLLVGVGHHLTVGGRGADPRRVALVDQGQLDLRQDVLGTPLPGSLVRSDVLADAGGMDEAFSGDGVDGLDLGWRTHLTGHRVVVAPEAVVRQGEHGLGVVEPRRTRIRQRQLALARGSFWSAPWRALGIAVTSALAALALLLVKRPAQAADEWADVRAVLSPVRGLGARRRFAGRRTVRPRDLRGLFTPASTGWRTTLDSLGEAVDLRAGGATGTTRRAPGSTETGPVSEEFVDLADAGGRRFWSWPLVLTVALAAALAGWRWRDLLATLSPDGAGVAGGELGAAATDTSGLWRSALDGWRGAGLGHDGAAEPWLLPLSLVARVVEAVPGTAFTPATAGVALGWVLLIAVPASVITAYLALRRVTHRRWLRAGLALGWAGLAPLGVAVGEGRVGPAVVHVLAPLLLAGLVVALTPGGGPHRVAATFATVLGVVLAAQWVPLVLVPATLAGLLLLVLGRGSSRWRGLALAALPWALLAPWLPALVAGPVRLLGGAGATAAGSAFPSGAPPWQQLLLHAGAPVDLAAVSVPAVALWLTVPLWIAALGALVLRGPSGRRALFLVVAAVTLLALAMVAPRVSLGVLAEGHTEGGQVVTIWPGTLLSLAGAALLLAAGLGLEHLARRGTWSSTEGDEAHASPTRPPRLAAAGAGLAAATVVLAGAASLGLAAISSHDWQLQAATDPLPAVAAEQARGPAAMRTLVLTPLPAAPGAEDPQDPVLRVEVDLRGAEIEPARALRDRAGELLRGVPGPGPVEEAAAAVTGQGSPEDAVQALVDLGVGYLLVEADAGHPLATQVERLPGLSRVSSPEGQVLWRMTDNEAARVRVLDADGRTLQRLDATGPHGASAGTVRDLPDGARLRVAEGAGWQRWAEVRVDGEPVAVGADGLVALPAGTHEVVVAVQTPHTPWHVFALALAAVIAFLALPFGRPEPAPEREEQRR